MLALRAGHNRPAALLRALLDRGKDRPGFCLRGVIKRAPLSTPDIVPEGARFIEGTYSNPAGSRAYRLFIPSGYQGQPLPLVVMLHGCTQSPDDFAAGTRMNFIAEEQTCFVAFPAQRGEANQSKCWNWFRTADQQRGIGEPSLIAGITRQIMRDYRLIQSASTLVDCRPVLPLPLSWEQPTTICTRQSVSIPASPAGPPPTCPPHLSPCDKVAGPVQGHFGARPLCRRFFFTAIATPRCIQTTAIKFLISL